jgi:hypothetical protein
MGLPGSLRLALAAVRGADRNVTWRGMPSADINTGNNSPPANLGQSYVTGMPVGQWPLKAMASSMAGVGDGVPGKPIAGASGNPAVSSVPYVDPPDSPVGQHRILGVGQESSWRGGNMFSNDKLRTSDRHILSKVGSELSGRDSGFTDPPKDGPARPSYQTINRTISYQQGTDTDLNQDDLSRPYTRNAQGMYIGEQGSGWSQVNGGVPGLWQPYGSYAGYCAGPVQGIQSPVAQGAPGDGRQSVWSGPPHGLHSPTLPSYVPTLGYYMSVPQMRAPRIDRPSNSTIGGQSYSQLVQPQGQTGTTAQQSSGSNFKSASAGVNWQGRKLNGWRGQAGAGNAS